MLTLWLRLPLTASETLASPTSIPMLRESTSVINSSITILNSRADRGSPCFTPLRISIGQVLSLEVNIHVLVLLYVSSMAWATWLGMPKRLSARAMESCLTVSKALAKSRKTMLTFLRAW